MFSLSQFTYTHSERVPKIRLHVKRSGIYMMRNQFKSFPINYIICILIRLFKNHFICKSAPLNVFSCVSVSLFMVLYGFNYLPLGGNELAQRPCFRTNNANIFGMYIYIVNFHWFAVRFSNPCDCCCCGYSSHRHRCALLLTQFLSFKTLIFDIC